ncbi:hypothetical protein GKC29_25255 [Micromonospora sp. WMMC415]|uniref:hypothetical protein n=1 Tax=Micromonospora sp. WMMC415 TaxID=2675222 RepID=UPI0012B4F681|nr:hypothetical protein [Micromonospora sp. WMMC415]QGN49805.1 hypothetical protein GKC29_25255 [Micromonospora sp. WMMC415]
MSLALTLTLAAGCGTPPPPGGHRRSPSPAQSNDDWAIIQQKLIAQGQALLAGDEAGWMAPVDPGNAALVEHYRNLFRILRALQVTRWDPEFTMSIPPILAHGQAPNVHIDMWYCFANATCPAPTKETRYLHGPTPRFRMVVDFGLRVSSGGYLITAVKQPKGDHHAGRPLPWESADLTVATGDRVIVAAAPGQQERLPVAVAAAERAAAATDRYSTLLGAPRPPRYIVYLAGDREWRTWNGGSPGANYAGYAYSASSHQYEVVVRTSARNDLTALLRHEFGHVVTSHGTTRAGAEIYDVNQWLTEGIAEYIEAGGRPATAGPTIAAARQYLRASPRMRTLGLEPLPRNATATQVAAFYGISHLAVDCMARRFGERNLFAFFATVVRESQGPFPASERAYGQDWEDVQRACITDIYRAVGL